MNSERQVFEIRRFYFRTHISLDQILDEVAFRSLPGGEYHVAPEDYRKAIRHMESAGFHVVTAHEQFEQLDWLHYEEVRASPYWIAVDDPESWTYLSPIARRWRRCLSREHSIQIRPGWALCQHISPRRRKYYVPERGRTLADCCIPGDKAIHRGYEGVIGNLPVPIWESNQFVYVLWPAYVIPKNHENFLSNTMAASERHLISDEGETIWVWHLCDKELLTNTLRGLRLRTVDWSVDHEWFQILSTIVYRSYGNYLKRRGGGQELYSVIRRRAWDEISDSSLAEIIKQLTRDEWKGNGLATAVLDYVSKRLCVDIKWNDYDDSIEGLVIESSPVVYGQQHQQARYYRMVIPSQETVLGWKSRRRPEWEGVNEPYVKLFYWRSVPYVGRIKTASRSPEPITRGVSRSFRRSSFRVMVGIPSIEWGLVRNLAIGSFVLDLDGAHWRGCHDMCRYFVGYGKIITLNPSECDGYGLLLEDVFGERFALETHELSKEHLQPIGDWVRFIAHSSLLHHTSWLNLERNIPVFSLKLPDHFRRSYKSEALRQSILACIRYHFGLSDSKLWEMFSSIWQEDIFRQAYNQLIEEEEIIRFRGKTYYRYSGVSAEDMLSMLEHGAEIQPYTSIRTLLHPLFVRATTLQPDETEESIRNRSVPTVYIDRKRDSHELLRATKRHLEEEGVVSIKARGAQIERAKKIVASIAKEQQLLIVRRCDSEHTFSNGDTVPSLTYFLRNPLLELQAQHST